MEIWKSLKNIVECGDNYEVSSIGRVRNIKTGRILKQHKSYKRYMRVKLSLNMDSKTYQVHRLVALVFIPNPENKPQVNHKDSVRHNNNVNNLEWATNKENQDHSIKNGRSRKQIGEDRPASKLKEDDVREIRYLYSISGIYTQRKLAEMFNVSQSTIKNIVNRKTWKYVK